MKELNSILNTNEKIIWEGKPNGVVYKIGPYLTVIISIIAVLLIIQNGTNNGFSILNYILLGVVVLMFFLPAIYRILSYRYITYLITDKRLILQHGLIGRDFDFVDYDKIESSNVNVGIFDKIMGKNTGTISVYANRMMPVSSSFRDGTGATKTITSMQNVPFTLVYITDPYHVFNLFKKVSFDIKSDINYPNKLRPETNEGYNTDYKNN